jgi:LPS-assembly protein
MTSRIRIFITATPVRHLLLVAALFTCQLPLLVFAQNAASSQAIQTTLTDEELTVKAHAQEMEGKVFRWRGDVEFDLRGYVLRADVATYDSVTGEVQASGGVVLDGGPHDSHLEASHAVYNVRTGTGTFFDVVGSIGTRMRGRSVVLTSTSPFLFTGRQVDKQSGDRYVVHHGTVTSCQLPKPKWTFNAETVEVVAGEDAKIYHSTFRLLGIPVFYFPFASHPVDTTGRKSGFMLPVIGQSTRKGFIFGESAYWAINRSADVTAGAEYFSRRGWAEHVDFRSRPGQQSFLNFRYFGVQDRGTVVTDFNPATGKVEKFVQDQGGQDINLSSELHLAHGVRAVGDINYLSSFLFRLGFSETYTQAINSEVKSQAFLAKNTNGYSLTLLASRYQNFQSTTPGDQILLLHMPAFEASSVERQVAHSPFVWSFDTAIEGISRREPGFVTNNLVGRFDVSPRLALPMHYKGWSLRAEGGVRDTWYGQQKMPSTDTQVGQPIDASLNRRAIEGEIELRPPSLTRVFEGEIAGRQLKHVIEPRVVYGYTSGVDQFQNIIRTDDRDILSNTSQVEFALVQRFFAKRRVPRHDTLCDLLAQQPQETRKPGEYIPGTSAEPTRCESDGTESREVVTWEVKQRHYFDNFFGDALSIGRRNVLTATADFTAIAFLTEPRSWSPVVSSLRVLTSANTDVQWDLAYDSVKGRINSSTAFVNYRIGEVFVGGSHAFLRVVGEGSTQNTTPGQPPTTAPDVFSQYRALVGYGHPGKAGLSAGASIGYDQDNHFLQYGAVQSSYNWDCCGLSFEYKRLSLGPVRNAENQFRFAFTLLNVGTFGNLRRQERLF